ncbi:retrovirus-related Pol polyprotein from transposon opus [Elysia marginata]|uniref:Retrovirus-related Pol polyprotein from transposon opus n=1 Tax=Elysia marginata TaxID=1093978 RepID=A0AAV4HKH8_9GAST|nr:retrovirus-related Pol polyprotein from transposon opus [Elysia marginata]
MNKCSQFNIKLNKEKLELSKDKISFMGHIFSQNGISTDPKKVEAIVRMPSPTNTKEVRRIMGMVQYLARYIPNLTNIMHPYLVTVDYYSQFIELDFLPETNSATVITKLKHYFARYGIPAL